MRRQSFSVKIYGRVFRGCVAVVLLIFGHHLRGRETTYSGPGQVLLPTWNQALEILSNFRLFPLKRRFGRNVDWSRKGRWALSIELGRYCLLKGGLTMEPYLGPLLTPSSPRSFVKAAIVDESIRSSHSR